MEIRKAEKKDTAEIAKLVKKAMEPQYEAVGDKFMPLEDYEKALRVAIDNLEFVLVAEEDNKIVAMIHYYYEDNECFVQDFSIDPDYHGRKIGTALINFMLDQTKKDRIPKITVFVPWGSPGIAFAKKFGFKEKSIELRLKQELPKEPAITIVDTSNAEEE